MTWDMDLTGHTGQSIAQDTASASDGDRHSLLIEVLLGEFAISETWVETMLARIEARP